MRDRCATRRYHSRSCRDRVDNKLLCAGSPSRNISARLLRFPVLVFTIIIRFIIIRPRYPPPAAYFVSRTTHADTHNVHVKNEQQGPTAGLLLQRRPQDYTGPPGTVRFSPRTRSQIIIFRAVIAHCRGGGRSRRVPFRFQKCVLHSHRFRYCRLLASFFFFYKLTTVLGYDVGAPTTFAVGTNCPSRYCLQSRTYAFILSLRIFKTII